MGIATINTEEETADTVAQKLAAAETELKQTEELHPLNTDAQIIRATVVFSDFEMVVLKID